MPCNRKEWRRKGDLWQEKSFTVVGDFVGFDNLISYIKGYSDDGYMSGYPFLALIPFGRTIVIWTNCAEEIADQAAEMGKA